MFFFFYLPGRRLPLGQKTRGLGSGNSALNILHFLESPPVTEEVLELLTVSKKLKFSKDLNEIFDKCWGRAKKKMSRSLERSGFQREVDL